MAIDPTIPLGLNRMLPYQGPSGEGATMLAQGIARMRQQAAQQQELESLRGAWVTNEDGTPNRPMTLKNLAQINPMMATKFQGEWMKADEEEAKVRKARIEANAEEAAQIASLALSVRDQATYDQAMSIARRRGLKVDGSPAQYDPGFVRILQMQAVRAEDYWKQQLENQRPMSDLGRINADEASGRVSPQQAQAMRTKLTTHAPGTAVYTGTLVPAVDETGRSVFAMPSKDGSAKVVPGIAPPPKEKGKTRMDAEKLEAILSEAEPLIQQAPGSYLGAGVALGKRAFGVSDESTQAQSQLKALEAQLMMNMPRMEGPQSDKDVALYRQQAGAIGDPTVATGDKLAALRAIRSLAQKYKGVSESPAPKAAPAKPSLRPGTVEDGYVFNGGDPSDPRNWKKVR